MCANVSGLVFTVIIFGPVMQSYDSLIRADFLLRHQSHFESSANMVSGNTAFMGLTLC